ncbi:MAG TPA: carboxypeptidase-like regulatory domain-containing protein [Candidatus Cybelea sp.]|jgi:protocatechuate 3,4-dioxygenase beta subunit
MKFSRCAAAAAGLALAVLVGHVTDATTGQPLPNVTIAIGSRHTTTDQRGAYRLGGLTPGHYTLSASSKDVPPQHRNVDVQQQNAPTTLDLVLCSTTLDYSCAGEGPG